MSDPSSESDATDATDATAPAAVRRPGELPDFWTEPDFGNADDDRDPRDDRDARDSRDDDRRDSTFDELIDDGATEGAASRTGRRGSRSGRRTDWRLGGRTVARWRERTLGIALLGLGIGLLGGGVAGLIAPLAWKSIIATIVLWVALLAVIVWAFARSRPVGLLRFWGTDLVWGLGLGVLLRVCQGWLDVAAGGSGALPTYPAFNGQPLIDPLSDVIAPVVVAPVVEELFFRAVVLVSIYTLLRRPTGKLVAGLAAALGSTGIFVLAHVLAAAPSVGGILGIALLGLVCSALVLLTGRIWGAVFVHVVYNGSWVALAMVGTILA